MIIAYHCYGSAHSSIIAAAIHVGILPINQVPDQKDILALKWFDKTTTNQIGTPFFFGYDHFNNPVYAVGMTYKKELVKRSIYSLLDMYQISHSEIFFVDALVKADFLTKVGGVLSRRYGIIGLGRPLTIKGTLRSYQRFIDLVSDTKIQVNKMMTTKQLDETNLLMDNRGRMSLDWGGIVGTKTGLVYPNGESRKYRGGDRT